MKTLGEILLSRIKIAEENGDLLYAARPWDLMRVWKYLGGASEAKSWLSESMLGSAEFMAAITEGFVSYSIGSKPRQYEMLELPDPELYDLHAILAGARKHLEAKELTEDARGRLNAVAKAIERHMSTIDDSRAQGPTS